MLKALITPLLVGAFLVLASVVLPQSVESREELKAVSFGLPISFVQQDASAIIRALPSPVWISWPKTTPTTIQWERFVGSVLIVSFVILILQQVVFGGRASYSA